jgi:hypothetical protein
MKRRDVFRIGAAAATPAVQLAAMPQAAAATPPPAATLSALDAHQARTLASLANLILPDTDTPGAVKAGVIRHLDEILADGDATRRGEFLGAVAWIDGFSMRRHQKPFADLAAGEQTAVLDEIDHGSSAEGLSGRGHFRTVKSAVASVYYATETGFRELNKGGRVPRTYGCAHPEHK